MPFVPTLGATVRLTSQQASFDPAERRDTERVSIGRKAVLHHGGRSADIVVDDLTRYGCRIVTDVELAAGQVVTLGIAGVGPVETRLVWHGPQGYGCEFMAPLRPGAVTAATEVNVVALGGIDSVTATAPESTKWSPRARVVVLGVYIVTPWVALGVAGYLFLR